MEIGKAPLILLCAGGTGGHLFPAQAAAVALKKRGARIALATDERVERYSGDFPAESTHIIPSATLRGGSPLAYARTATMLGLGLAKSWSLLGKLKPAAVVGFGGYPTVPPMLAASFAKIPTIIHEQNGVLGRANRLLAPRARLIATGFPDVRGVSAVVGANLLVRRAAFDDVGGLDTSFPVAYNDIDFCLKLRRAGWRILYVPDGVLLHKGSASFETHQLGREAARPGQRRRRTRHGRTCSASHNGGGRHARKCRRRPTAI